MLCIPPSLSRFSDILSFCLIDKNIEKYFSLLFCKTEKAI